MISEEIYANDMELLLMHLKKKGFAQVLNSVLICFLRALSSLFGLGLSAPVFATQEILHKKNEPLFKQREIHQSNASQKFCQLGSLATLTSWSNHGIVLVLVCGYGLGVETDRLHRPYWYFAYCIAIDLSLQHPHWSARQFFLKKTSLLRWTASANASGLTPRDPDTTSSTCLSWQGSQRSFRAKAGSDMF